MGLTTEVRLSGTQSNVMTIDMYVSDCPSCGVYFGITKELENRRRQDGRDFYCPNGHVMHWNSEREKERKRLIREAAEAAERAAQMERDRSFYQQQLRSEREEHKTTTRKLNATRGVVTRQKKRAQAAACPVTGCKRTFRSVREHLAEVHPGYVESGQPVEPQ